MSTGANATVAPGGVGAYACARYCDCESVTDDK